jgi:surfactin synthase thioesterase subunit
VWLHDWSGPADVDLRVLCLPPAGGAARMFRGWAGRMPAGVGVVGVEPPGHGSRSEEKPVGDLAEVLDALVTAAAGADLLDAPLVVFGHSMGALVGWALCAALQERHPAWRPALFVAAASEGPGHLRQQLPTDATAMTDEDLMDFLRLHGGMDEDLLADAEYRAMLFPTIRADLAVSAAVVAIAGGRLRCPVRAYVGTTDPAVGTEEAEQWRDYGPGGGTGFAVRAFEGGHFFVQRAEPDVVAGLVTDIAESTGWRPAPVPTWTVL